MLRHTDRKPQSGRYTKGNEERYEVERPPAIAKTSLLRNPSHIHSPQPKSKKIKRGGLRTNLSIIRNRPDLRVREDAGVELRGRFAFMVEPETWRYQRGGGEGHGFFFSPFFWGA